MIADVTVGIVEVDHELSLVAKNRINHVAERCLVMRPHSMFPDVELLVEGFVFVLKAQRWLEHYMQRLGKSPTW